MGGVVDTVFGGEQRSSGPSIGLGKAAKKLGKQYPDIFSTPFSAVDRRAGLTTFDPFIRNTFLGGLNRFTENTQAVRNRLLSNENPFTQAMVDPYLRAYERGRGELQRNVARTGVRGTFADRSLQDYDISGQRELGNVRAEAEARTLEALNMLDKGQFEADRATALNILDQEFRGMGLPADIASNFINAMVSAVGASQSSEGQASPSLWGPITDVAAGLGVSGLFSPSTSGGGLTSGGGWGRAAGTLASAYFGAPYT